jgi:hypothetical protein
MPVPNDFLDALPRSAARTPALAPPVDVPPVADARLEEAHRRLRDGETPSGSRWLGPFVLILVVALDGSRHPVMRVALATLVLLLHEVGHLVAIRAFGHRDTRVFFFPFFDALAGGEKRAAPPWERGVVLLSGSGPGIVVACAVFALTRHPAARACAVYVAYVNVISLAPIAFDGGQMVRLLLTDRAGTPERAARALTTLTLVAYVAWQQTTLAAGVAMGIWLGSSLDALVDRAALRVRPLWPELPPSIDDAPLAFFADAATAIDGQTVGPKVDAAKLAVHLRAMHERLTALPPSRRARAVLAATYVALVAAGTACALAPLP